MHIELISKSTVKITVSAAELESFGLNYDMIQTESKETHRLISEITDRILLIKDIDLSREKLYIEVFSDKPGGCLMYISGARGKNLTDTEPAPVPENAAEVVYYCRSIGELIQSAREIKMKLGRNVKASSLFYSDEDFCLIIAIDNDYLLRTVKQPCDTNASASHIRAAHIKEHCTPILEEKALERLSELTPS